jgi:hypothetical protein
MEINPENENKGIKKDTQFEMVSAGILFFMMLGIFSFFTIYVILNVFSGI